MTPKTLDQTRLNLADRSRTSRAAWRGQFSPEFIDYLIDQLCADCAHIHDPFCGSGTVLFEAISKGKCASGTEINPAAWHLGSLAEFASAPNDIKRTVILEIMSIAAGRSGELFSQPSDSVIDQIRSPSTEPYLRMALASAVILGMRDDTSLRPEHLQRGAFGVLAILREVAKHSNTATCSLRDARNASDIECDAIITSPPYINVFNYHQNYRPAVELLGWHPLEAAKVEIGANRKFRQNRFLTIVQYCIDMQQCLANFSHVLSPQGILIMVVGRTSNVLGAGFSNSGIMSALIESSDSFEISQTEHRVFTNRFGESIYEDIIISRRTREFSADISSARAIGSHSLKSARNSVPQKNQKFLEEAIESASSVCPSPEFSISMPPVFQTAGKISTDGSDQIKRAWG